jgi:hypothetical protein
MSSKKVLDNVHQPIRTATSSSVRAADRCIMLNLIRQKQPISRAEMVRLTRVFSQQRLRNRGRTLAENVISEQRSPVAQRGWVPFWPQLNDLSFPVLGLNIGVPPASMGGPQWKDLRYLHLCYAHVAPLCRRLFPTRCCLPRLSDVFAPSQFGDMNNSGWQSA